MSDRLAETLQWCRDWREGMFTPAPTNDGWTVEMHGLVSGLLDDLPALLAALKRRDEALAGLLFVIEDEPESETWPEVVAARAALAGVGRVDPEPQDKPTKEEA